VFLDFCLNFGDWIVGGGGSVSRHSLLVHHKLGEVPFDGVHQEPGLLLLEKLEERMGVVAIHIDLGEHVELHVVLGNKLLDFLFGAGFLAPELVAGKPENA